MDFTHRYLDESVEVLKQLDRNSIEAVVDLLAKTREQNGRVFVLGVGGSAATGSHFVNDLRKLAHIEAYAPTDNVSELTARTNDEGWASVFEAWLKISRLHRGDGLFILSVGGGDEERNISPNLVRAIKYAKSVGASVMGIVGRAEGFTAKQADACVVIPQVHADRVTAHSEAFQGVVGHLIISHPKIKVAATKWESAVQPGEQKKPQS